MNKIYCPITIINPYFLYSKPNLINTFHKNNSTGIINQHNNNKKYTYFLVGGYEHSENKNKIKLYRFYLWKREMEFIKDIGIEKNDSFTINNDKPSLKSIIQNGYNNLIISYNKGEAMKLDIMNLENTKEIEKEEQGNILLFEEFDEFIDRNYGYYSYDLKDVDMSEFLHLSKLKDISIEYIYQLENGYFIIVQKNNISVVFVEDKCIYLCENFKIQNSINCICEIKKSKVIIIQNDGLYELVFSNNGKNIVSLRLDKINDMKLNFFSNKNDYIISCESGTFRVFREISSISEKDLIDQNKLSNKKYDIIEIIEINKQKFAILIDENILEIIDLDKSNNRYIYKIKKRNNNYALSKNCIVSFKTKKDSNNHIFICAQKNEIFVVDIRLTLNKSNIFECKNDLEITCMCPFKKNIKEEKYCPYFLIGGIKNKSIVQVDLYTVLNSDEKYNNCTSIELFKTVVYENERMTCITSMYQSVIDGELIIASDKQLFKLDIQEEEIEEE